jgi:hypothetical protein
LGASIWTLLIAAGSPPAVRTTIAGGVALLMEFIMMEMLGVRQTKAIEAAWRWFCEMDGDIPFAEVVRRCPEVDPERIRVEFKRRLAVVRKGGSYVGRT